MRALAKQALTKDRKARVYIAAEISANHGQVLSRALSMIHKAKECGADAVKFQTYTPDTLTLNVDSEVFRIHHPKWGGQTLYQLYQKAYTPWSWFKKLKKEADTIGIDFFSTAFDKTSIDFLEDLGVFCHKIASFELVDIPLIRYAAKTRKPLIMSTGMATLSEIHEAIKSAKQAGARDITILKCVSSYPADPFQMNLRTIPDLKKRFSIPVGLSDHTLGTDIASVAVSLGACFIEKHFTLSRKMKTPDSFFSLEPQELRQLIERVRLTEQALGCVRYGPTSEEEETRTFRRSLFVTRDIKKDERFTVSNIGSFRPACGMKPKMLPSILGKKSKFNLLRGTALSPRMINGFVTKRGQP